MKLYDLAHVRAGDKGDISNIAIIAYRQEDFSVLCKVVTPERIADFFGCMVQGKITCYELPNLGAINLVLEDALGGGVTRSLALDTHGKCMATTLLDLEI